VEISSAGYAPEAIFSHLYLVDKTRIPALSSAYNTRAQLLQKGQDSFTFIVWSCNGKAVNLKNPPIFTTLVKMTSPATVS